MHNQPHSLTREEDSLEPDPDFLFLFAMYSPQRKEK